MDVIIALLRSDCFVTDRTKHKEKTFDLSSKSSDYGVILKCINVKLP